MRWSDLSFSDRTIRQFAGLCIVFFGGLALWQGFVRGHTTAAVVLGLLALTLGPIGLLRPALLRPIYIGWMALVFPVGWLVSHVVLAALFYGLFTPIALYFKLISRDTLARRYDPEAESYWQERTPTNDPGRYFRQY